MKNVFSFITMLLVIMAGNGLKAQTVVHLFSGTGWATYEAAVLGATPPVVGGLSYTQPGYSTAGWTNSANSPASGAWPGPSGCGSLPPVTTGGIVWGGSPMWYTSGTTATVDDNGARQVYFRQEFTITTSTLVSGSLSFLADNQCQVYINGHLMGNCNSWSVPVTVSYTSIQSFLVCGTNVITIVALNGPESSPDCWWVSLDMNITADCPATLSCATANIVPKVDPANTNNLTCSQIYDNGTNVGINTTNPITKLHVNGQSVWLTNGDGGGFGTAAGSGLRAYYDAGNDCGVIQSWNYGFGGGAKNTIIQQAGGSVGIGVTSFTYATGATLANGTPSPPSKFTLSVNGWTSSTAFVALSDKNFKKNVQKIETPLDKVNKLNGVTYFWDQEKDKHRVFNSSRQIGYLAQDVEKVIPEAVVIGDSGIYGLNYNMIIPVLSEAIKELNAKVTQTQQANAELQQQNVALQNQINDICNGGCATIKNSNISGQSASSGNLLLQNIPNPFSQQTTIGYVLNTGTNASLDIYSLNGKIMKHINLSINGAGSVVINSNEIASGTYTYTLIVDDKVVDTKLMVITAKD